MILVSDPLSAYSLAILTAHPMPNHLQDVCAADY